MVTISVVVPIYNNAEYLRKCLASIVNQSRPFDQIVLVDDLSTDARVREIIEDVRHSVTGIEVVYRDHNGGICQAQNDGLRLARSSYVAFVDCDDWLEPRAVEIVALELQRSAPAYLFTDRLLVNDEGQTLERYDAARIADSEHWAPSDRLMDHMFASHLKVIDRSILETVGGFLPGTEGVQDWDLALRVSEIGILKHIAEPLYCHRVHDGQNSTVDRVSNVRKTNEVRRRAADRRGLSRSVSIAEDEQLKRILGRACRRLGAQARSGDQAFAELARAGFCITLEESGPNIRLLTEFLGSPDVGPACELLIIVTSNWVDLGTLRRVLARGTRIAYMVLPSRDSVDVARWFNSYFDYILLPDAQTQLAMLNYCWAGIVPIEATSVTLGERDLHA